MTGKRIMTFCAVMVGVLLVLSVVGQAPAPPAQGTPDARPLRNADVVKMVELGLDSQIIVTKIRHSAADFDVSTEGLVDLKKAGVPSDIVTAMIERPTGPPKQEGGPGKPQQTTKKVDSLGAVRRVYVKAPTEVIRTVAEKELQDRGGPASVPENGDYEAVLVIGIDCGQQTMSYWTGSNYCTCEGSMTVESGGVRLWSTTDHDRSANGPKAAKHMVGRMTEEFARTWKKGQPKK